MFDEQRPIKPDPKYMEYLANKQKQQRQRRKKQRKFLQKQKLNVLPCQKQFLSTTDNRQAQRSAREQQIKKTKAQIYEQIKNKNRQKFGQWNNDLKLKNKEIQEKKKQKETKLHPSKMTVSYKPRSAVQIDTRQYKKQGFVQNAEQISNKKKKESAQSQKMQYKKMVQYMKKLYSQFQIEKQKFDRQKEYLKFKKTIENENGIQIKTNIKNVESKLKNQSIFKSSINKGANDGAKHSYLLKNSRFIDTTKKYSQAQEKSDKIKQKKQKSDYLKQQKQNEQPKNAQKIQKFHYKIQKLYEMQPFTLLQISKYVNLYSLLPQTHQYFKQAQQVIQKYRKSPEVKVQYIKPKCIHGSIGTNHAVCCSQQQCTQKRVTNFGNNWYQLWVPNKYRTVYNSHIGYKVVWFSNQDIKQQFQNGKVIVYACKAKKLIQVQVQNQLAFQYYPFINQLQMKDRKGNKEIIFEDGRHQIVMNTSQNI